MREPLESRPIRKWQIKEILHRLRLSEKDPENRKLFGTTRRNILQKLLKTNRPQCPYCNSRPSPIVYYSWDAGVLLYSPKPTGVDLFLLKCTKCKKLFLFLKKYVKKENRKGGIEYGEMPTL